MISFDGHPWREFFWTAGMEVTGWIHSALDLLIPDQSKVGQR